MGCCTQQSELFWVMTAAPWKALSSLAMPSFNVDRNPRCHCTAVLPTADKRTALHISAAEGNLQAVRLLVEEGGADMQGRRCSVRADRRCVVSVVSCLRGEW